ncbi:MAG TPA: phage baseplate assembly protein V [Nannocystis sp.]|jgi:uncharacterized protein involved in type VI secretion and phage assembly
MSELDLHDDDDGGAYGPLLGLLFARVSNVDDPAKLGRVKVALPGLSSTVESAWARVLAPGAGSKHGVYWPLEMNDEVVVGFVGGHPELPIVLGALWSATKLGAVPEGSRRVHRLLTSASGHLLRMDDTEGAEKIELIAAKAENAITLDVGAGTVTIAARTRLEIKVGADITLTLADGKVSLACKEFSVSQCKDVTIASDAITLDGSQSLALNGTRSGVNINNGALDIK